ncbi:hypothetical protein [Cohnella zeiphila]|uniref:Uncharacterized protein n=1 Tax=Cohnella zeiphila TaxID=2761120 RepID=A0A7X0SMK0_9BACL|nr:hypothetical protein [Cohnella zeiphila]MBB6732691.1 hypothetical protein [Cohnella zeiphila]
MKNKVLTQKQWDQEFEKNSRAIMPFEKWKALPDKSLKRELIRAWRKQFTDKSIRETWDMKFSKYYYYLKTVDLKGAGGDIDPVDRPENSKATSPEEKIIEAEWTVIEEEKENSKALVVSGGADAAEQLIGSLIMSFRETGTPERIMKRLKAIAANLELEEDDLELNIQVWRR